MTADMTAEESMAAKEIILDALRIFANEMQAAGCSEEVIGRLFPFLISSLTAIYTYAKYLDPASMVVASDNILSLIKIDLQKTLEQEYAEKKATFN